MPSGVAPHGAPGSTTSRPCALGKNNMVYTTNRGNENNFGMHANKVQLGGPGEEEHIADFWEYGQGDGECTWPMGIAIDDERDRVYCSDEWTNTISVFDTSAVNTSPSSARPAAAMANC